MLNLQEIQQIELELLIKAIKASYGHDFSGYAMDSLTRRVEKGLRELQLQYISEIIPLVLHDRCLYEKFFLNLSVNVTEMFRDPLFFLKLRESVLPELKAQKVLKIWVAGCSTGEEVYSLAIMLKEENLYDQVLIYATDFNDQVLAKAEEGIYPLGKIRHFSSNYRTAGGKASFADYFHSDEKWIIMDRALKKNIIFSLHNLAVEKEFSKVDILICRNVMIYFDQSLQETVFDLFDHSLISNGFLCLGMSESLQISKSYDNYTIFDEHFKIFRKKSEESFLKNGKL